MLARIKFILEIRKSKDLLIKIVHELRQFKESKKISCEKKPLYGTIMNR